jgi:hypothetical protein
MKKMIFARSPAGIYVPGDDACSVWYVHHMDKAVNEPTFRTLEQAKYYVRKIEGIIEKSY